MNLITFQEVKVGRIKELKDGGVYLVCTDKDHTNTEGVAKLNPKEAIEIGTALIIAGIKGFFTKKF